jgi:hypothetical protein
MMLWMFCPHLAVDQVPDHRVTMRSDFMGMRVVWKRIGLDLVRSRLSQTEAYLDKTKKGKYFGLGPNEVAVAVAVSVVAGSGPMFS